MLKKRSLVFLGRDGTFQCSRAYHHCPTQPQLRFSVHEFIPRLWYRKPATLLPALQAQREWVSEPKTSFWTRRSSCSVSGNPPPSPAQPVLNSAAYYWRFDINRNVGQVSPLTLALDPGSDLNHGWHQIVITRRQGCVAWPRGLVQGARRRMHSCFPIDLARPALSFAGAISISLEAASETDTCKRLRCCNY